VVFDLFAMSLLSVGMACILMFLAITMWSRLGVLSLNLLVCRFVS